MNDEQLTIFRRRNIGFIFQNYNLVPILNVYENIVLPVELDGDTVDQKFLDEIVHLLGLEDKLKNMPKDVYKRQVFKGYGLYRIGGDEFLVLCLGIEEKDLREHVEKPVSYTHLDVYKRQAHGTAG